MKTSQVWARGETVQIGFVRGLVVEDIRLGRRHEMIYFLRSPKGARYKFTPYEGLKKIYD